MWGQIINIIAGLWAISAPQILGYDKGAANNGYIAGPIIITFAVIALWEVNHEVRLLNLPIGMWLLVAPWVLNYGVLAPSISDLATGAVVILCSLIRARTKNRYGGGWRSLLSKNPEHMRLER